MKELKSNLRDLHVLFGNVVAVRHIAETLECCRDVDDASSVRQEMEKLDFNVMGIKNDNNIVYGYVERSSLEAGECRKYARQFCLPELTAESMPLDDFLPLLRDSPQVFVLEGNRVNGIITRGDLQKAPVRMFLFGLVTLLEMQLLRIIRISYSKDSWNVLLKENRLEKAQKLLKKRKGRNEAIDLADCLQFCDKGEIIFRSPQILESLHLDSKCAMKASLKSAEKLRNKLAHGQDLVTGSSWPEIIDCVREMETLLECLEKRDQPGTECKADNT